MQVFVNTPGCKVSVKDQHLVIKPPDGELKRVPLRLIETIFLQRSTLLSAELAFAAVEHDIDVQFSDRKGKPIARIWNGRFGSISVVRKKQLQFAQSSESVEWVRRLLADKCENQSALLLSLASAAEEIAAQEAALQLLTFRDRLLQVKGETLAEAGAQLRGQEAAAAKKYFSALSTLLPPKYRFDQRSQHPARDMFNCMLNYAYGILYGQVESALIKAGVDPFIGVFHRDEYNRPVLVYDFIERFRHWADFVVASLCRQELIFIEFFEVEKGAFWLNTYGKRILIQSFADYLQEVIRFNQLDRSRQTHLELSAQAFASYLKDWRIPDSDTPNHTP